MANLHDRDCLAFLVGERQQRTEREESFWVRFFGMTRFRISGLRSLESWCLEGTDESVTRLDSLFSLMHHELCDPGPLIQVKMIPQDHAHFSSKVLNGFQKSAICMKLNKQVKHILMNGSRFKKYLKTESTPRQRNLKMRLYFYG